MKLAYIRLENGESEIVSEDEVVEELLKALREGETLTTRDAKFWIDDMDEDCLQCCRVHMLCCVCSDPLPCNDAGIDDDRVCDAGMRYTMVDDYPARGPSSARTIVSEEG